MIYLLRNLLPFSGYPYAGEDAACNLCGARESVTLCEYDRRLKRLKTVACGGCGLIRTDPMPTDAELARYYAAAYRLDYQLALGRPPRFHLKRSRRAAQARLALLEPAVKAGGRLLDFGSGSGEFLAAAARAGMRPVGIEPGRSYARFAVETHAVEVVCEPWHRVEMPERHFDVITTNHVIEHLNRPVDALRTLAGWLKEDGVLHVSVPDMSPRPKKQAFELFHFAHVHGFTPRTLRLALEACGLEPDPRFPAQGTTLVCRKTAATKHGAKPESDADASEAVPVDALPGLYPSSHPARHLVGGRWLADTARRAAKDARDTLSKR